MRNTLRLARVGAVLCLAIYGTSNFSSQARQPQQGGQQARPTPTPINQSDDPILKKFRWRSIGPASMGGRIDDIAGVENNPYVFYIGFATGGVWKTVNNGTTWEPIFDIYPTSSIGDIAVCQSDPNIIWVGTGEPNNRQSSSFGDGIYKSTDGGKTFVNVGLKETQTIARVVIDPKDANTVYVAALGRLFGPNKERGIYKTTDGGKTWVNVKFIDEDTGFTDIVIDPVEREDSLRRFIPAPPRILGLQRRRTGQRHLEDGRRRQDVDEARRQWFARRPVGPHRPRRLALEPERRLRADRSRRWRRRWGR